MTKAFSLNFSMKALFFSLFERKERLPKLVRQPLNCQLHNKVNYQITLTERL